MLKNLIIFLAGAGVGILGYRFYLEYTAEEADDIEEAVKMHNELISEEEFGNKEVGYATIDVEHLIDCNVYTDLTTGECFNREDKRRYLSSYIVSTKNVDNIRSGYWDEQTDAYVRCYDTQEDYHIIRKVSETIPYPEDEDGEEPADDLNYDDGIMGGDFDGDNLEFEPKNRKMIYQITAEEFCENDFGYESEVLNYYIGDDTLVEEINDEIMSLVDTLGTFPIKWDDEYDGVAYFVNHMLSTVYEVNRINTVWFD